MIFLSHAVFLFTGQTLSFTVFYGPQAIGFSPAKATKYPLFIYELALIIAAGLQSSFTYTVPLSLYGGPDLVRGLPRALSFPICSL